MTNTKSEILALLKRNGGLAVGELATALGLAPITVRQHLTHLQRDGFVIADRQSGTTGRPHYVYRLTAKAHAAAFPRRTDRLVELLVREVGLLEGRELDGLSARAKTSLVLRRLASRLADEFTPLLQGWPLQERVAFVTEVMHADGGFAEWAETSGGYEIRDFNCLFHRLLHGDGRDEVCEWHESFLRRTLGADVYVVPCSDSGRQCCRFLVQATPIKSREAVASAG